MSHPAATPASALAAGIDDRIARRNVAILACAQALGGASASIVISTGPLIGAALLGPDKSLATLPVSFMVLGTAIGMLPAGMLMRRFGRRTSFLGSSIGGTVTALLAALAVLAGHFWLFTLACGAMGFVTAFVQQFRFAAADTASDAFRPRAISWVMAGGILAGVIGPQTVILTRDLLAPILFAGTYVALAGLSFLAFLVLWFLQAPPPVARAAQGVARPLSEIMRQPAFLVAATCGIVSYALMSLVMTATPLAMIGCGLSTTDAALAIQWHVLAMFGPSFFTGALIARFGVRTIVVTGLALLCGCGIISLSGQDVAHFWVALILLGLGWNFGFIGATTMLTACYRPAERTMVQSANDFLVFGFVAFASFSSGSLLHNFGWGTVNVLIFPVTALCLAAMLALGRTQRSDRTV
ncbi:MFS transporter [Microvirga tunisiensis]|uniref:MFS transporter n=1 Tax=Pannonibacter tanglangensis TaxID=2750084 RepID=A0A7X5F475_9HYPH|nr:MFS transporter [Pannonibacter sp. XCT-53]NBN78174.1 MFS transporter [Pannonibacter sp. XCT-53]